MSRSLSLINVCLMLAFVLMAHQAQSNDEGQVMLDDELEIPSSSLEGLNREKRHFWKKAKKHYVPEPYYHHEPYHPEPYHAEPYHAEPYHASVPVPAYHPPVPAYQPPVPAYQPPVPAYQPPVPAYHQPLPVIPAYHPEPYHHEPIIHIKSKGKKFPKLHKAAYHPQPVYHGKGYSAPLHVEPHHYVAPAPIHY